MILKNLYLIIIFFISIFLIPSHIYIQGGKEKKPYYKIDTIIDKGIYKSYFNYKSKEPVFVAYKLYKGGGDCNRESFSFKNDTKINIASDKDYAKSGYDKGHLANSEDFASNCEYDEKTFRYYNAVPQTPNLNRGTWKQWETKIREESQTDSLFIICGSFFGSKKIGEIQIPTYCWKVVKSLSTKKITHIFLFTNTDKATCKEIKLSKIEIELGYSLPL